MEATAARESLGRETPEGGRGGGGGGEDGRQGRTPLISRGHITAAANSASSSPSCPVLPGSIWRFAYPLVGMIFGRAGVMASR
jgi:hypothetical protein